MEATNYNQYMYFTFHFCALIFLVFRISYSFVFSNISGSPLVMNFLSEQSAIDTGQGWESDPLLHKLQKKVFHLLLFFFYGSHFPLRVIITIICIYGDKTSHYFPPFLTFFTHRQTTEKKNVGRSDTFHEINIVTFLYFSCAIQFLIMCVFCCRLVTLSSLVIFSTIRRTWFRDPLDSFWFSRRSKQMKPWWDQIFSFDNIVWPDWKTHTKKTVPYDNSWLMLWINCLFKSHSFVVLESMSSL